MFPAAPPHLRVLVAFEVDLLVPQRRQQRIQHEPVVQVLLNVVGDVRAIQLDVLPFRERLLCENPVGRSPMMVSNGSDVIKSMVSKQ